MALSKRETILAWGVGTVGLLLAVDLIVIEPFFAQRAALAELRAKDDDDRRTAADLARQQRALTKKWESRKTEGLASDPKDAEHQVLGALKDWAGETGVVIASVKPDYVESKKDIREIMVQASASGNNEAMVKFLFKLQTAKFPVRVTELKLSPRADSEELAVQLKISTLYLVGDKNSPPVKKEPVKKEPVKKVAKE